MKKAVILGFILMLMISIVSAVNYDFLYNPYTARQDRSVNLNQSGNNITADWFFGKINWSDVQNKFITAVDNIYIYMSGTTATFNTTKAGTSLAVNSSDHWGDLDTTSDINAGDITDDNTYARVDGETFTGDVNGTDAYFSGTATIGTLDVTDYGLAEDDIPTLSNRTLPYCGNITGAVSNLCILVDTNETPRVDDLVTENQTLHSQIDSMANLSESDVNTSIDARTGSNGSTAWITPEDISDIDYENICSGDTCPFAWNISGTDVFPQDLSWYVGIGTATPSHELNVVGDVNVTGNLTAGEVYIPQLAGNPSLILDKDNAGTTGIYFRRENTLNDFHITQNADEDVVIANLKAARPMSIGTNDGDITIDAGTGTLTLNNDLSMAGNKNILLHGNITNENNNNPIQLLIDGNDNMGVGDPIFEVYQGGAVKFTLNDDGDIDQDIQITGKVGIGIAPNADRQLYIYTPTTVTTDMYGVHTNIQKSFGASDISDDLTAGYFYSKMTDYNQEIGAVYGLRGYAHVARGIVGAPGSNRAVAGLQFNTQVDDYGALHTRVYGSARGLSTTLDLNTGVVITGDGYGAYILADNVATVSGNVYMLYLDEGTGIDYGIYQDGTADNYFGGKVGIGTATPAYPLDIKASVSNQDMFRLSHPTSPTNAGFILGFNTDGTTNDNVISLGVEYSSADYDVINIQRSTRNVGIGTTTPSYPLEINGDTSGISLYVSANMSSTGYNTRTSVYDKTKGSALDYIQDSDYYLTDGEIDHEKFYSFAGEFEVSDYDKPVIEYYNKSVCDLVCVPFNRTEKECNETIINETEIEECWNVIIAYEECEEVCVDEVRNRTTYPYNKIEKSISLNAEIDVLRQAIFELKEENIEMRKRVEVLEDGK